MTNRDSTDIRREHPRHDVDWRVILRCPDWPAAKKLAAFNASRGGIFLLTTKPPPVGAKVELNIALPDGTQVTIRGTVQHGVSPQRAASEGRSPGVGVKFDEGQEDVVALLEHRATAPRPQESIPIFLDDDLPDGAPEAPRTPRTTATSFSKVSRETPPTAPEFPAPEFSAPSRSPAPAPAPAPTPAPAPAPAAAPPPQDLDAESEAPAPAPAASTGSGTPNRLVAPFMRPAHLDPSPSVGIDFGTSYSSISVSLGGRVVLIPDAENRTAIPSVVHFPDEGDPIVGWDARARMAEAPHRTVASAKRLLGRRYSEPSVQGMLQSAGFPTACGPNDSVLVAIDDQRYAIPQVCAMVIRELKQQAELYLGFEVEQAVFSVPVAWTEAQVQALRRAAQLAGLEVTGLIQEPVAAAVAYGLGQGHNEIVGVYDFGGGTFDFSLLDLSGDQIRLLGSAGDPWLGGDDFDQALAQDAADTFWRSTGTEVRQRVVEWTRLLLAAEVAKRQLSSNEEADILVPRIVEAPRPMNLYRRVDRPTFEALCTELFDRSLEVCQSVLERVGLDPWDVTQVVVTGGMSQVPFIRRRLGEIFEREITPLVDPDVAICLGAGLQAASLSGLEVTGCGLTE